MRTCNRVDIITNRVVKPAVRSPLESTRVCRTYLIYPLKESSEQAVCIGTGEGVGEAPLKSGYAGNLPSPDKSVGSFVDSAEQSLPTSDRQLVDVAGHKAVLHAEVGRAVVALGIMIVHESLPAGSGGSANAGCSRFIIHAFCPSIESGERQRRGAALQLHRSGMVVGVPVPIAIDVNSGEVQVRFTLRLQAIMFRIVGVSLAEGEIRRRNGQGLRDVASVQQVSALVPYVVDLQRGVPEKLALDRQVPLLQIWIAWVVGFDDRQKGQRVRINGVERSEAREQIVG